MVSPGQMRHNLSKMIPNLETVQAYLGRPNTYSTAFFLLAALSFVSYVFSCIRESRSQATARQKYERSIKLLDQMLAYDPSNAMAIWRKGQAHEALGMPDRALSFYRAAHLMCPRAYGAPDFNEAYHRIKGKPKNDLMRV